MYPMGKDYRQSITRLRERIEESETIDVDLS